MLTHTDTYPDGDDSLRPSAIDKNVAKAKHGIMKWLTDVPLGRNANECPIADDKHIAKAKRTEGVNHSIQRSCLDDLQEKEWTKSVSKSVPSAATRT